MNSLVTFFPKPRMSKPSYSCQAANFETTKGKLRARTNGLALIVSSPGGFISYACWLNRVAFHTCTETRVCYSP